MDKSIFTQHISRQFNAELEGIVNRVMGMGGLVEQQLGDSMQALVDGNQELAETVLTRDYQVNAMEVELDEACTHILARRQPTASDLRLVMAVIKTITDLERIGDEAERVGRTALHLLEKDRTIAPLAEIASLGEHVGRMLHNALDAFTRMDAASAARTAQMDINADSQYEVIIRELLNAMQTHPEHIPRLMEVIWATRSLERIGDRSRNICEYVIYFVKGKDVRHTSFQTMAEEATGDRR
jgi:phosphate transport system protein